MILELKIKAGFVALNQTSDREQCYRVIRKYFDFHIEPGVPLVRVPWHPLILKNCVLILEKNTRNHNKSGFFGQILEL